MTNKKQIAALVEENARLREGLLGARGAIESGNLDDTMCCNGYECGCQGATGASYAIYHIDEALKGTDDE